jgi:transposase
MLKVPQQQYIKYLREMEGCSIREIMERTKVDWRTAKKYADREDWNESLQKRVKRFPSIGPYIEIVDTWLMEDQQMPRKQRHSARRIFHRLRDEHGFQGGERTVSEYVARRKKELVLEYKTRYERLEHPPAEAQADFGDVYIVRQGKMIQQKVMTLSFPYSNAAFTFPVPRENTACFLESLKRIFEEIQGVPRLIWFDNLSAAVSVVGKGGDRTLTDAFSKFVAHYRFAPTFCNPASGNEKGNVENKVGYGRRNWCVPVPTLETQEEFEEYLRLQTRQDRQRPHYQKQISIEELWQEETKSLLALPVIPYEVFQLKQVRVNSFGEIQEEGVKLPLPQCKPGQQVIVKAKWDSLDIFTTAYEPITSLPRPYMGKEIPIPWEEVLAGLARKPRSVSHSSFVSMMPKPMQAFLRETDTMTCKLRIRLLRQWLESYSIEQISLVLEEMGEGVEPTLLENRLYQVKHLSPMVKPFSEPFTPSSVQGYEPDLQRYDQIIGRKVL